MSEPLNQQHLRELIHFNRCPDCQSHLLVGPQGGTALNVLCSNEKCRSEFNVDTASGAWGHRNGKASDDRIPLFGPKVVFHDPEREATMAPPKSRPLKGGL